MNTAVIERAISHYDKNYAVFLDWRPTRMPFDAVMWGCTAVFEFVRMWARSRSDSEREGLFPVYKETVSVDEETVKSVFVEGDN